jgi:hypothetical protein
MPFALISIFSLSNSFKSLKQRLHCMFASIFTLFMSFAFSPGGIIVVTAVSAVSAVVVGFKASLKKQAAPQSHRREAGQFEQ